MIDTIETERAYLAGGFVKAISEYRIGGYLAAFGFPKDSDGDYFSADTNFHLDYYGFTCNEAGEYIGGQLPVLYHHALTPVGGEKIGIIDYLRMDESGLYAEANLQPELLQEVSKIVGRDVYTDIRANRLGWSSGSAPHLVNSENDGLITEWGIVEGTLTYSPKGGNRTTVQAIKAANEQAFPDQTADDAKEPTAKEQTPDVQTVVPAHLKISLTIKGYTDMNAGTMIAALEKAGLSPEQVLMALKELGASEPEAEAPAMAENESETPAEMPPSEDPTRAKGETHIVDVKAVIAAVKQQLTSEQKVKASTPRPAVKGVGWTGRQRALAVPSVRPRRLTRSIHNRTAAAASSGRARRAAASRDP
jgi:hypothetical protein